MWPALPPAAARVDLCETTGEVPAATADIVSPRLTAHPVLTCVREASSVDVACQEVPVVAAFSPQEKKKKDAHISSTSLLRTKAVRGATTPIKGRQNKGVGVLTCVCEGHCIAVSSRALCKVGLGGLEDVDRGKVSGHSIELAPALYEVSDGLGRRARLGIEHS